MKQQPADSSAELQHRMMALVRGFGLHRPDTTPCGQAISVAEAYALLELERAAPLSQNDLASRLLLEKSTVSRLVAALEARGWISRTRSQEDGRRSELSLTDEGRRIQAQVAAARAAKFQRVLAALPEQQRGAVLEALHTLVEAMNESE